MKKNRILIIGMILALFLGVFVACKADASAGVSDVASSEKINVVCTIFPEYDWVNEIVSANADNYDITLLLDNGTDLHSYQPTAEDMAKISKCDLFIYVGGESDAWVEDALKEATNDDMKVINLLDTLGSSIKEEEIVEGMQAEEEEEAEASKDGEEEIEYDEHVWLSLKNAEIYVKKISETIAEIDSANSSVYKNTADEYIKKLNSLDEQYESVVASTDMKTVLFCDRFPFRYLVDDYGLSYYAAFVGCSAETEASFDTITFLANKLDELSMKHVLVIESSDQKIAQTVIENTKDSSQDILVLDSMQSTTSEDIAAGTTYLDTMEKNLEVLTKALK